MTKAASPATVLLAQRSSSVADGNPSLATRIDRLDRAICMLLEFDELLIRSLNDDFGGRSQFSSKIGDILGSIKVLEYTKENLSAWMRSTPVEMPPEATKLGMRAEVVPFPVGVIGAIVPWNGPILMTIMAMAGAFGAGNRIMVKVSEYAPLTAKALAKAVSAHFPIEEAAIIEGDAAVAAEFSALPFDFVHFTGSTNTGRHVAKAAADNLVPVLLEMGGKCPVIVGRSADMTRTARRIVTGKLAAAGQVCVSPDYIYLPRGTRHAFIAEALATAQQIYPGMLANPDYSAIINQSHRARLKALLDDAEAKGATLVRLPAEALNEPVTGTRFPFVMVTDVTPDMRVMQEEIFGPILPILEYGDLAEPLRFIASNPNPLSAYYFGTDERERDDVLAGIQAGGMVVNDVRVQILYEALPFGGVGASGMGRFRGYESFRSFSNMKTVLHQTDNEAALAAQRPPFGEGAHAFVDGAIAALKKEWLAERPTGG